MGELLETVYLAQDRIAQSQKDGAIASLNHGLSFFFFFPLFPPSSFFFEGRRRKKKGKKETSNENQSSGLTMALQASVDWKDTRGTSSTIWHAILLLLLLVHNFGVNKQTSKTF